MTEEPPRLKAAIRVSALMRRLEAAGVAVYLRRRGDADAGTVCLKLTPSPETVQLLTEQRRADGGLEWQPMTTLPLTEPDSEDRLTQMIAIDPDLWIVEIDDPRQKILSPRVERQPHLIWGPFELGPI